MSRKRRSVFDRAVVISYGNIGWEITDVQKFRPGWDDAKATMFLLMVQERLAAATLMAGWAALEALILEYEKNGDQSHG